MEINSISIQVNELFKPRAFEVNLDDVLRSVPDQTLHFKH